MAGPFVLLFWLVLMVLLCIGAWWLIGLIPGIPQNIKTLVYVLVVLLILLYFFGGFLGAVPWPGRWR